MAVRRITAERNTRNPRVAAYIRVSTDNMDQDESYEAQQSYYEGKIKGTSGWDFAGVYGDRESGTHAENREEFGRMIRDAEEGKIDLILCKSVSRFSRNIVDELKAVKHLTGNRINIIFEQEGIDTRQPGYTFQLNLATAVAQTESESISENLKWLYRKRAENGIFKAAKGAYFGYRTDDGSFTPDGNAPIVRRIYEEFVQGKTVADIARGLEGVLNNQGKPITPAQIRGILKNEVYKGDVHICKTLSRNVITGEPDKDQYENYVKGHHEAIVDEMIWEQAQDRFKTNAVKYRGDDGSRDEEILAMVEEGLENGEIAEYLGISKDKVRYSLKRLVGQGRLEKPAGRKIRERMELVYQAIKEGHGYDLAHFLGMKYAEVHYALQKLEKEGKIVKKGGEWVTG